MKEPAKLPNSQETSTSEYASIAENAPAKKITDAEKIFFRF